MKVFEARPLVPWEEGGLRLREIAEDDGCLIAIGDKVRLRLPLELRDDLGKYFGMKISILKTDNGYCIRIQDEQSQEGG